MKKLAGIIVFTLLFLACSLFEPKVIGTVKDIDGNIYPTVKIGDQWWMAENLKVTHYRNGDEIPKVTNNSEWDNLRTGAYCNYGNNDNNVDTCGSLYNGYTINDSLILAPRGWRIPTDDDWKQLELFLGIIQTEINNYGA